MKRIYIIIGIILAIITSSIVTKIVISTKSAYYQSDLLLKATNEATVTDGVCKINGSNLTNIQNKMQTTIQAIVLNKAYSVGSIYMSTNSTSPAVLFGGTWEQLNDRFLLGAGTTYTAGATGGEATHKLTIAEMPSHTHNTNVTATYANDHLTGDESRYEKYVNPEWKDFSRAYVTTAVGGNTAHNNMPPYLVVYMWKRTK